VNLLSRGLRYGDGFFDTMLLLDGQPVWSRAHWDRMVSAAGTIGIDWPNLDSSSPEEKSYTSWIQEIQKGWSMADRPNSARVRTVVWRSGDGDYFPLTSQFEWRVSVQPIDAPTSNFLSLGPSPIVQCPPVVPWFKSLSAMPYILAARFAASNGWDDALLINSKGQFIESSRSNLFYWLDNCCYTPSVMEGCLPGIAAQFLIQFLSVRGYSVQWANATYENLRQASGIWLTNSLRGVVKVYQWDHHLLSDDPYSDLAAEANAEIQGGSELL